MGNKNYSIAKTAKGKLKIVDANGFSIANLTSTVQKENEANAEFICKAVNNYDSLVELLKPFADLLPAFNQGIGNRPQAGEISVWVDKGGERVLTVEMIKNAAKILNQIQKES